MTSSHFDMRNILCAIFICYRILLGFKLTKLFHICNFSGGKDSGKVIIRLIIIIYYYYNYYCYFCGRFFPHGLGGLGHSFIQAMKVCMTPDGMVVQPFGLKMHRYIFRLHFLDSTFKGCFFEAAINALLMDKRIYLVLGLVFSAYYTLQTLHTVRKFGRRGKECLFQIFRSK